MLVEKPTVLHCVNPVGRLAEKTLQQTGAKYNLGDGRVTGKYPGLCESTACH